MGKVTPALKNNILHKDTNGPNRKQRWDYRSAICMLDFLSVSTIPDILCVVHQCARYCNSPKLSYQTYHPVLQKNKGAMNKNQVR